jgi:hypothetical protein
VTKHRVFACTLQSVEHLEPCTYTARSLLTVSTILWFGENKKKTFPVVFKIISKQFKLNLLTGEDADNFRRELKKLQEAQAADSEGEGDAFVYDQASIDSQCASLRAATAYAVSDGDYFYHLAKSLEHVLGTFESAAKAEQAMKSSLTKGLTEGQMKNKIVELSLKNTEWEAESKRSNEKYEQLYEEHEDLNEKYEHLYEKCERAEGSAKRAKLVTSDDEADQEPWMGWNPADVVGSD